MDILSRLNPEYGKPILYTLLFIGLLMEGEIIILIAFYLVNQGKLDLGYTITISMFGILIGDTIRYFLGKKFSSLKIIKKILNKIPRKFDEFIIKEPKTSIIVSKFIYGFHRSTLLRLKDVGITYINFLKADIPGAIIWLTVVGSLGYFFSNYIISINKYLKYGEITLLLILIVFLITTKIISKFMLKKIKPKQ